MMPRGDSPYSRHMDWDFSAFLVRNPRINFAVVFVKKLTDDRITLISAGVAFYGLLAIFPTLLGLVSLFGLVMDPVNLQITLQDLKDLIPSEAYGLLEGELNRLANQQRSTLGLTTLISLGVALWGSGKGVRAMMSALNVAYREDEARGFIRLHAVSLTLTLAGMVTTVLMVIALIMVPIALRFLDWIPLIEHALALLRWPIVAGFFFIALSGLYRFGADHSQHPGGLWPNWGALTAIVLWVVGSAGLSHYVADIAGYSATYQGLSAVIVLMMWLWMSALVVLVGASLNAQLADAERQDLTDVGQRPT